jgi:hypothetical protein
MAQWAGTGCSHGYIALGIHGFAGAVRKSARHHGGNRRARLVVGVCVWELMRYCGLRG